IKVFDLRYYLRAHHFSVYVNKVTEVVLVDSFGGCLGHLSVQRDGNRCGFCVLIILVLAHGGFVDEIKTDKLAGNTLVPFGPHIPVEAKGIESFLVEPQVVRFMEPRIDAVTRGPVKVEANMYAVFVGDVYNTVNLLYG